MTCREIDTRTLHVRRVLVSSPHPCKLKKRQDEKPGVLCLRHIASEYGVLDRLIYYYLLKQRRAKNPRCNKFASIFFKALFNPYKYQLQQRRAPHHPSTVEVSRSTDPVAPSAMPEGSNVSASEHKASSQRVQSMMLTGC